LGDLAAIVLAAGRSTRMKSDLPKVLHEICGRPMLGYVLQACRLVGVDRLIVVVGYRKQDVISRFDGDGDITWAEQAEQKGTGHAVACCRSALDGFAGSVLVIAGDMPLLRRETLAALYESREDSGEAVTMATTILEDPAGYGRIIRDEEDRLVGIVEDADCTPDQKQIREVNPSYYCFDSAALFEALDEVQPVGPKGEYYITEAVRVLREAGKGASAPILVPAEDAMGINSRVDLVTVGRAMQDRLQQTLLDEGVTIVDPDNTWVEAEASVGRDTTIQPFSFIGAGARIGEDCRIGPFAYVAPGETIAPGSAVGPTSTGDVGVGAS